MKKNSLLITGVVSILFFISSCSFSGTMKEPDFTRDYERVVHSNIPSWGGFIPWVNDLYTLFYPSGYDNSWLKTSFDIAGTASGDIFFAANALRETYQKMSADMVLTGSVTEEGMTPNVFDMRGKFVMDGTSMKPYYGFLEKFDLQGEGTEDMVKEVQKYFGKWYVYDIESLLGASDTSGVDQDIVQFVKGYLALIMEIQDDGFEGIKTLLSQHRVLTPLDTGVENGKYIDYQVALSRTGIIDLLTAASMRYTGSGLSTEILGDIREEIEKISFSGVLSVAKSDPLYYSLIGKLGGGGSGESIDITIISDKDKHNINVSSSSGSFDSLYTRKESGFEYAITISEDGKETKLLESRYEKGKDILTFDATLDIPDESSGSLSITWPRTADGAFSVWVGSMDKSEYFETKGNISDKKITTLQGTFVIRNGGEPEKMLEYSYTKKEDDTFVGKMAFPQASIEFNGKAKKEDFFLDATAAGMSLRMENKKIEKDLWKGMVQFPIGKADWKVKTDGKKLEGLDFSVSSPLASLETDLMSGSDEWVRGPYSITIQGVTISSGSLGLLKKPKYFGARLDTTLPDTIRPSFVEFLSMVDITYDKNAKVEIPKDALIFDMSGVFPSTMNPTFMGEPTLIGPPYDSGNVDFAEQ